MSVPLSSSDQIALLQTTELFHGVSGALLREIYGYMEEIRLSVGTVVFEKGDTGDAIYLVMGGELRMESDGVPLVTVKAGQCFGEMALIDRSPRSASSVVTADALLLRWERDDFLRVISREPQVAYGIFKMLSGKLRHDIDVLVDLQLEQSRWQRDLERAREVQMGMLPESEFRDDTIEIAGHCQPAAEVGGDYYDYLGFDDARRGLIIADVTGHGFYAGLFVAMAKSCLNTQARVDYSPHQIMEAMGRTLSLSIQRSLLMSCFYVLFDPLRNQLAYCNAGHPHPYHYSQRTGSLDKLQPTDTILGIQDLVDSEFREQSRVWESGDLLVLYSDGITEARNEDGEMFEYERFEQCIADHCGRTATEIRDAILEAV